MLRNVIYWLQWHLVIKPKLEKAMQEQLHKDYVEIINKALNMNKDKNQ